ncbi:MAG: ABC transporter ATP-binding protein [Sphaerochaetaceae bacterium]
MDSLICSEVSVQYPEFSLSLSFSVPKGALVSIIGPSGCGKSTTLQIISGLLPTQTGTITLNDKDITRTPVHERNIALVFQDYALFPHMNVAQNIAYPLKLRRESKQNQKEKVESLLKLVSLAGYEKRKIGELSGGERQRVAFARALASEPELLLLDEPLSALDAKNRKYLRHQIRSIHKKTGITTLYVTHDQEEALSLSDLIIVMKDGHIEQVGTPQEVYHSPHSQYVAQFMGEGSTLPVTASDITAQLSETSYGQKEDVNRSVLFFRPEHVLIEDQNSSIPSTLLPHLKLSNARLISCEFLGTRYLLLYEYDQHQVSVYSNSEVQEPEATLLIPLTYISFFLSDSL